VHLSKLLVTLALLSAFGALAACGGAETSADPAPATGGSTSTGGFTSTGGSTSQGEGGSVSQAGGTASDPLTAPATCTSKASWTRGENTQMRPGEACIACHTSNDGPTFSIAGTVYPSGHEPNDCNGAPATAGAVVVITDARNKEYRLSANAVGNFSMELPITPPYRAKLVSAGKERVMATQQTAGDCNSCHTQAGANGAPGRITLPR
jgi:hypothetical protein